MQQHHLLNTASRFAGESSSRNKRAFSIPPPKRKEDFLEFTASFGRDSYFEPTPGNIEHILEDADAGNASAQAACYRFLLEREPVIAAHFQTRMLAVLSCDWSIQCDQAEKAAEVTRILEKAGIHSLLEHLLDALAFGYAGAAVIWDEGGSSIQTFEHIDPVNWIFDAAGNPALITLSGTPRALTEYHPSQFVFFQHRIKSGHPSRGGLLRPLLHLYLYKHYAMRDRARYLERFGIPFLAAKIREEDFESESIRGNIMESLSRLGSDGVGLLTEGADLQILSTSESSSGEYQSWLEYLDRICALMILGQTASSGNASGFSKGQMQENVRRDLLEADCRNLMDCINRQILQPLERFRYGSSDTLHFKLDYSYPENLVEKASIVKDLCSAGYQVSPDWVESTFGLKLLHQDQSSNNTRNKEEK